MTVLYWIFFIISIFGILSMTLALLSLTSHFSKKKKMNSTTQALSLIVPIKGADDTTHHNLTALVNSDITTPVEYLFAMETEDDPAYEVCKTIKDSFTDKNIRIIITGESKELMGKQYNIKGAIQESSYDIIGSMDADVKVSPTALKEGLESLNKSETGIVYFLPYYEGTGTLGGGLLNTYINNFYNLIFSYLHFFAKAPTVIGALWIMPKELFQKCGADGRFANTVSDDRELGFATAELGYKNYFMPQTVMMPHEKLSLNEGINHLEKWFGMIRAEGIFVYIIFALLWNPLVCALFSLILAFCIGNPYVVWSLILFAAVVLLRIFGVIILNKSIYKLPVSSNVFMTIFYDILIFPVLVFINLFRTTIEWKGKVYKLGKHGRIISID